MEIWKNIKDYENNYEVSNLGRVRAKKREFIAKDGNIKRYPEHILKPEIMKSSATNYERVSLSLKHKVKRIPVHRLVAEAFISNPENKPFINHIDNNGLNNNVENLEWCTHSENMIHAQKQGRLFKSQSKGGQKGGQVGKNKALQKANALIGTTKFKWFVHSISPIRRNNKLCLNLICLGCNKQVVYTMEYFNNYIGTACPACRKPRNTR